MVRFSFILSAVVSLSLAAQPMRVSTPRPISATRTGVVAGNFVDAMVASNGSSFLVAWGDDRIVVQSLYNQGYGSGLLMRIDADGMPLDESPIALPFFPFGIVWNGSEWIAANGRKLARISAEGTILEVRSIEDPDFLAQGVAWAGNALVVVGPIRKDPFDYELTGGVRSLTFDAELHLVASEQLTDTAAQIVATAGDGQSAITLWRDGYGAPATHAYHGASFGPDGLLQQVRRQLVPGVLGRPYGRTMAIGATSKGYVLIHPGTDFKYKGAWIERDLDTRPISLLADDLIGIAGSLAWDGTSLLMYSTDAGQNLRVTGFSAEGFLNASPRKVGMVSMSYPAIAAAGIQGKTIVAYADNPRGPELKVRVLATPDFADSPERSPAGAGPLPQDIPMAVSTSSQSLVAWRERTSQTQWGIYATRLDADATVLDPDSLRLATSSCNGIQPAVATDGENYLAAWHDKDGIAIAAIRADGTFTKRTPIARHYSACPGAPLKLLSNGTDYLLLWVEKPATSEDIWDLIGLRLRVDGSIIDTLPIAVGKLDSSHNVTLRFEAASNGHDYLIAWEGAAVRVSGHDGALLDTFQKIQLGAGFLLGLWWNGTTYVAEMSGNNGFRFLRIGSDGSGGRSPAGPQADEVPFPPSSVPGYTYLGSLVCGSAGCWAGATTRHPDGHDSLTAIRYEDDGTKITIRRQDVENVSYTSVCDSAPVSAEIVNVGRLAFLYLPQRMEQPFSSVHRLMIAPLAIPRGRAASHP